MKVLHLICGGDGIEPVSNERVSDILKQEGIPESALLVGMSHIAFPS